MSASLSIFLEPVSLLCSQYISHLKLDFLRRHLNLCSDLSKLQVMSEVRGVFWAWNANEMRQTQAQVQLWENIIFKKKNKTTFVFILTTEIWKRNKKKDEINGTGTSFEGQESGWEDTLNSEGKIEKLGIIMFKWSDNSELSATFILHFPQEALVFLIIITITIGCYGFYFPWNKHRTFFRKGLIYILYRSHWQKVNGTG